MAKLPKVEPVGFAPPGENPFALPVARDLGPKPGESLFSPPPPKEKPLEAKLPEAKPPETKLPEAKAAVARPEPEPAPEEAPPPKSEAFKLAPLEEKPVSVPRPEPEAASGEEEEPSAALFLPSSTKEIVVEPEAKRAKSESGASAPPPRETAGTARRSGRPSAVYLAALAGGALGLFSVGAIFMMMRSEPTAVARSTGASPFGKRAAGDASMTPVLDDADPARPNTAATAESMIPPAPENSPESPVPTALPAPVLGKPIEPPSPSPSPAPAPVAAAPAPPVAAPAPVVAPKPAPPAPAPAPVVKAAPRPAPPVAKPKPPAAPKKAAGPQWVFEGVVYDLLSTRGAYGVRLVFVDADDNEVASVETGDDGRYRVAMKPGPPEGYSLRILHDDYTGKHIDEMDSTSSLRNANLEQRKFLAEAGSRSLSWIGDPGKTVRRDMALVPKIAVE